MRKEGKGGRGEGQEDKVVVVLVVALVSYQKDTEEECIDIEEVLPRNLS